MPQYISFLSLIVFILGLNLRHKFNIIPNIIYSDDDLTDQPANFTIVWVTVLLESFFLQGFDTM